MSFSVIHGHFMLFHQRLVFFMKDMVVHLQICELSGALAEPPFKMWQVPISHRGGIGQVRSLRLGTGICCIVLSRGFIVS